VINIKHEELTCSCCGYTPDSEDINKTGYHLVECSICHKNICDICAGMDGELVQKYENDEIELAKHWVCAKCEGYTSYGQYRKEILAEEYIEGDFNIDEN